jgi:hypothetical protein
MPYSWKNTAQNCFPLTTASLVRKEVQDLIFVAEEDLDITQEAVLFSRQNDFIDTDTAVYTNQFSCPSVNRQGLKGRVIVTFEGTDEGSGSWKCDKDGGNCAHITSCRSKFQKLLDIVLDVNYVESGLGEQPSEYM